MRGKMFFHAAAFTFTLSFFFVLSGREALSGERERPVVMFWNLENFYDYIDQGTGTSDTQFSSFGSGRWTKARFRTKCDAVAKTILWVADRYGGLPAVVGLAEVENAWAVRRLIDSTALKKFGYRLVHYDSPDRRGIDVALLYREEVFELLSSKPCHVYDSGGRVMRTRDILLVELRERGSGEVTWFAVNHHPSKYGGEAASRPARLAAMNRLKSVCDSLFDLTLTRSAAGEGTNPDGGTPRCRIIAMGDFNDSPGNPLFGIFGKSMVNKALPLYRRGMGTIKYQGRWELIDMFFVSADMDPGSAEGEGLPKRKKASGSKREGLREEGGYRMDIVSAPFLLQKDNAHVGEKPFRTYSGPRYIGGVSDHLPIVLY